VHAERERAAKVADSVAERIASLAGATPAVVELPAPSRRGARR
jgi:hypothetical protein